jgi:hypothetical protein
VLLPETGSLVHLMQSILSFASHVSYFPQQSSNMLRVTVAELAIREIRLKLSEGRQNLDINRNQNRHMPTESVINREWNQLRA